MAYLFARLWIRIYKKNIKEKLDIYSTYYDFYLLFLNSGVNLPTESKSKT